MSKQDEGKRITVCVTAAGGYIGSSMVRNLLDRGYTVHATVRDLENPAKTSHLLSLPGAKERLHLFKADIYEQGSFDSAIQGCDFLINLATGMDPQRGFVDPVVEGTLDILRACKKSKSVKRVVHISSIGAAFPLNEEGKHKELLDESCWTPVDYITRKSPDMGMYCVSKTLAEQAALRYGEEEGIEVVTLLVAMVGGFSLAPGFPSSLSIILAPVTGNRACYETLVSSQFLMGSMLLVHLEDVCNAHIFLMEHPSAAGRYVCCSDSVTMADIADFFRRRYPETPLLFGDKDEDRLEKLVPFSSKKLTDLGFSYEYGMEEIYSDSFECAKQMK
ncbi:hypothetical protein KI387_031413, partial [Taxus chinensis]